jgi:predicted phage-related endonuclease
VQLSAVVKTTAEGCACHIKQEERMKASVKIDLSDLSDVMESLRKRWSKMTLAEQIDVRARLAAVIKHCEFFDKDIKDVIKAKLGDEEGEVPGETFKACMRLDPVTRLDQTMLKVEHPKVFALCNKAAVNRVVTFVAR